MPQWLKDLILCVIVATMLVGGIFMAKDVVRERARQAERDRSATSLVPARRFESRGAEICYSVEEIEIDGRKYLVLIDSANMARCIIPKPVSAP